MIAAIGYSLVVEGFAAFCFDSSHNFARTFVNNTPTIFYTNNILHILHAGAPTAGRDMNGIKILMFKSAQNLLEAK